LYPCLAGICQVICCLFPKLLYVGLYEISTAQRLTSKSSNFETHCYNNNNNTLIYIAPACRMTSEALLLLPAHSKLCKRWYSQRRNARLSGTLRYCITTKKASVMISSPSESQNILVSRNIWFITKFGGHPERRRFMRLGWVKIVNFDDFST